LTGHPFGACFVALTRFSYSVVKEQTSIVSAIGAPSDAYVSRR
jgi:hypothetical protein